MSDPRPHSEVADGGGCVVGPLDAEGAEAFEAGAREPDGERAEAWMAVNPDAAALAAAEALVADPEAMAEVGTWTTVEIVALLERVVAHVQAVQAVAMGHLAHDPRQWDPKGRCYVAEELAAALGISRWEADHRVAEALAVTTCHGETLQAWDVGAVDRAKVRKLLDEVALLPAERAVDVAGQALARAEGLNPREFAEVARELVVAFDPDAARRSHERERRRRTVGMDPEREGMARLWAYLPADAAMTVWTALQGMSARQDPDDERTLAQRRADAFTAVFADVLDRGEGPDGPLPRRKGRRDGLVVHIDAATLAGLSADPAHLAGYGPVPAEVARSIARDATWQRMLTDPDGRVQGIDPDRWRAGWTGATLEADGIDPEDPLAPDPDDPDGPEGPWDDPTWPGRGGAGPDDGAGSDGDAQDEEIPWWLDHNPWDGPPPEDCESGQDAASSKEPTPGQEADPLEEQEPAEAAVSSELECGPEAEIECGPEAEPEPEPAQGTAAGPGTIAASDFDPASGVHPPSVSGGRRRRPEAREGGVFGLDATPAGRSTEPADGPRGRAGPENSGEERAPDPVGYRPSAWLVALVRARDRRCAFPGCRMPAERCDLDHIVPFDAALPARLQTTAANLAPLCRRHHEAKTTRTWSYTRQAATGLYTWTSPTGHVYTGPADPTRSPWVDTPNTGIEPQRP